MAELVFEIWMDPSDGNQSMTMVHPQTDKLRLETMPNAVCVHRFTASSTFDTFRQNNAWNDWGPWKKPDMDDHVFTDEEVAIQHCYLEARGPVAVQSEHIRPSTS